MKKTIIILITSVLLPSCAKKEEKPLSREQLITGLWKIDRYLIDGFQQSLTTCLQSWRLSFAANKEVQEYYTTTGCETYAPSTWATTSEGRLIYDGYTYNIIEIDNNNLGIERVENGKILTIYLDLVKK